MEPNEWLQTHFFLFKSNVGGRRYILRDAEVGNWQWTCPSFKIVCETNWKIFHLTNCNFAKSNESKWELTNFTPCRAFSLEFELSIVVTFEAGLSRHALLYDPNTSKLAVLSPLLFFLYQKWTFTCRLPNLIAFMSPLHMMCHLAISLQLNPSNNLGLVQLHSSLFNLIPGSQLFSSYNV